MQCTYCDLLAVQSLTNQMFRDRAEQFIGRLKWNLEVNSLGEERDKYDDERASYLIYLGKRKQHVASLRIRPFDQYCMTRQVFGDLVEVSDLPPGQYVEITRFCSSILNFEERDAAIEAIFKKVWDLICLQRLDGVVAVFDRKMMPIYSRIGWRPRIVGELRSLNLGLWKTEDWPHSWRLDSSINQNSCIQRTTTSLQNQCL